MTKTDGILLGVRKSGAGMTYQNYTASQTVAISIALDSTGTEVSEPDSSINSS